MSYVDGKASIEPPGRAARTALLVMSALSIVAAAGTTVFMASFMALNNAGHTWEWFEIFAMALPALLLLLASSFGRAARTGDLRVLKLGLALVVADFALAGWAFLASFSGFR